MKTYGSDSIRNVALVGHGHCGKTSLTSAMLFAAGAVNRMGSVDDGSSTTDYDPDEIEKKQSLQLALAHVEWNKAKVNLIDTPGYANFIYEAKAGLRVADGALVLLEAVSGVEVQTERVWGFCDEFAVPRLVVVNRMDRDNASAERVIEAAREKLGREVVPIQVPIGSERDFKGVVDLVTMKAHVYEADGSGKFKSEEIPSELVEAAQEARRQLMEMVAELDDELMNKYLETEELEIGEFERGLVRGVQARQLVPALYAAGARNVGTAQVLDAVVRLLPPPTVGPLGAVSVADGSPVERGRNSDEPLCAFVFKTIADPFAGKLSYVRVYSGRLAGSDSVYNATRDSVERVGHLLVQQGKAHETIDEACAGEIVAIAKLKETTTNDTLCTKEQPIQVPKITFPEPAIAFAIDPKTRGDEDKLASGLARISEEDPTVHYGRDPQTNELLVSGMGNAHVEVVVGKLRKKFGVEVVLHTPKVPYRETIKRKAEAQGRHKKQSGGRGQFGDCWIRLEPMPRGGGYEFADEIFGGSIPNNFRPAVDKGIQESALRGYLAGFPVVDFKVVLTDGSYHSVDSSEIAFKIAGSLAFKKAMSQASPVLLEPVMAVTVQAPDDAMGDIIGQLNTRRGRIQGMEGGVVTALVPMAEMLDFAPALKSLTSGRGSYHMERSHYDEVPGPVAQKVIDANQREHVEEEG